MASALAVIIAASTVQFAKTTRNEHELILLRQLIDSAQAWVQARGGLPIGAPVTLDGEGVLSENVSGQVTIGFDENLQNVVVLSAEIHLSDRVINQTARFANPYYSKKFDSGAKPHFSDSHPGRE